MEFTPRIDDKEDTIAAIATPPGEGGIAVIRISGKNSLAILEEIFSKPTRLLKSHRAYYGKILGNNQEILDDVLVLPMLSPKSFTGETVVEIHCHGGNFVPKKILQLIYEKGARAANPGEFSFRAFQNGKIDLTKAEAIQQLISAKNEIAMRSAKEHLQGKLQEKIAAYQQNLSEIAAILEAWVDYPEEGLEFATTDEVLSSLENVLSEMNILQKTFHHGKMLFTGYSMCLLGKPNVGKSSLLNALSKKDKAIVTPIAGTTRDLIEDTIVLENLHFNVIDTAGLRDTQDLVEKEGVKRSEIAGKSADIILLLIDANDPVIPKLSFPLNPKNTLVVLNKIDLVETDDSLHAKTFLIENRAFDAIHISCLENLGITTLEQAILKKTLLENSISKEEVLITNERHFLSLKTAQNLLENVITGLKTEVSPEFLTYDLKECLKSLGQIIGTNVTEDILNAIFSKFCVGK